jgi:WD40 repeat protein
MVGEGLMMRLFGAESRGWFQACRFWVRGGVAPGNGADCATFLRGLNPDYRRLANLCLDCAGTLIGAREGSVTEDQIARLADEAGVAHGLVRDVLVELASPDEKVRSQGGVLHGALRGAERAQIVTALLTEDRGQESIGILADLHLELVPQGTGQVYPTPALAFLRRAEEFERSAVSALEFMKRERLWPDGYDLRWHLTRRDEQPLCALLLGNSLGGCFAFGLAKLLASETGPFRCLCKLALAGVAVSATIEADGRLGPVGGIMPKLLAAARDRAFPRVHTLVASVDQDLTVLGLEDEPKGSNVFCDPFEDFHVLRAPTLETGIELLRRDEQERWHGIDCQLPPLDPDFTGREALFARVRQFVADNDTGYLVLLGAMGIGKSAFMSALLHAERATGNVPVFHLISSAHTGSPEQIAACLYDRLRRKYRIPEPSEWASFRIEAKLERLMLLLSEKLQAENRKEVLYIEGADQAQLAPHHFLLPDALGRLPRNFLCVVTSRFQSNWHRLHDQIEICNLSEVLEDQIDVRVYLRKKAKQIQPPLEEEFIERIVTQPRTPVFFTVVACFRRLKDPATPEETRHSLRSDPNLWAVAPKELIARALKSRLAQAQAGGLAEDEFWIALGLLTVTGDDLLGAAQLEHLGVLTAERKAILENCASLFQSRPTIEEPERPYVFAHPGYVREIQERAGPKLLCKCHELLANGCAQVLSDSSYIARGYALRHYPGHLRHAQTYDKLSAVLTDLFFLQETLGADSTGAGLLLGRQQTPPAASVFRLAYEFRRACEVVPESHAKHLELRALGGVIDKYSHLLQDDPSLLPQLLRNELIWQFGSHTPLGDRICAALNRQTRPWLRCVAQPERRQSQEPVRVLSGHQKAVLSLAFSPDRRTLASGSADKTIRLWLAMAGGSIAVLQGHHGAVNALAFSPDGLCLASGSSDGAIIIWDPRSRRSVQRIEPGSGPVLALAFTRDNRRLVSGSADGILRFWDALTWRLLQECRGHGAAIRSVAVSPDGTLLASGGEDKTLRVWQVADGASRATIREKDRWIEAVAFLHDNRTIVSSGGFRCGDVKFWNLDGRCISMWPGHSEGIKALAISGDGLKLASGSYDGKLLVRNVRTAACFLPMGNTDRIEAVAFSQNGEILASASADRKIRIWDVAGEPVLPALQDDHKLEDEEQAMQGLSFLAEGRLSVVCSKTNFLKLLETATATTKGVFQGQIDRNLSCVAASADSQMVAAGSFQHVRLWHLDTVSSVRIFFGHSAWVLAVSFSPDGKRIVAGGDDDNLILWETGSGARLRTFCCQQSKIRALAFSPEGSWLASGGEDGTLKLWNPNADDPPRHFELHKAALSAVVFSPLGNLVATGSEDESVRLTDYVTGIQYPAMRLHRGTITCLAFSSDARYLASGSTDCTVRVWDTQNNQQVAWTPCADRVLALRFDADSLRIQVADAGGASQRPGFLVLELTNTHPAKPSESLDAACEI